jgi:predicted amidohydrolase YtcJ
MFQGEIVIREGIITELLPNRGNLVISFEGKRQNFGNSFAFLGFTDSHLHLLYGGEFLSMTDLSKAKSEKECIELIKKQTFRRGGKWIFGRGWNQENWTNKSFPTKDTLDLAFPNEPVCLIRQDGHCLWVNSKALEHCGITKDTPQPQGGEIVKDESGQPTGVLIDEAIELVRNHLPKYSSEQLMNFIEESIKYLAQFGITTVHDMDVEPENLSTYYDYYDNNNPIKLNLRIFLSGRKFEKIEKNPSLQSQNYLKVVGLKYYMDGALGSYGALLSEPYADNPSTSGLQLLSVDEFMFAFKFAAEKGFGLAIHSIGDKATSLILDSLKNFIRTSQVGPKFVRIEHCQVVNPSDIPKFNELGVVASVQPIHFVSDYVMAMKRLGDRTRYGYPWKSFVDNKVLIISGSDFPIENPNPLAGIQTLVSRNKIDGDRLFGEEEISLDEALRSYTFYPGLAINEAPNNIEIGMPANLTILDQDPYSLPSDEIHSIKVIATIVQGQIIYQS